MRFLDLISLVLPAAPTGPAAGGLLLLRVFTGLVFIRHGWPKLSNLNTWAAAMKTPSWLCFLSAFSMWAGGIALILGILTPLAALAIAVSMLYAVALEIKKGFPFIAPDPFQIPEGDYAGPMGVGDPPSWEKAAMYVVMCGVLITSGGGPFSVDLAFVSPTVQALLG